MKRSAPLRMIRNRAGQPQLPTSLAASLEGDASARTWVCAALWSMLDFLGGAFFLFLGVQLVDESVEVLSGNWFKGVFGMLIGALVVVLAAVPILSVLAGARISNEIESWERTRRSIGEKVDR